MTELNREICDDSCPYYQPVDDEGSLYCSAFAVGYSYEEDDGPYTTSYMVDYPDKDCPENLMPKIYDDPRTAIPFIFINDGEITQIVNWHGKEIEEYFVIDTFSTDTGECPICHNHFEYMENNPQPNYCCTCHLDWDNYDTREAQTAYFLMLERKDKIANGL